MYLEMTRKIKRLYSAILGEHDTFFFKVKTRHPRSFMLAGSGGFDS